MTRPATQRVLDKAIGQAPATIAKLSRGKPTSRERKTFQAFTVSQLLKRNRDPRDVLLEIASTSTLDLAKTLAMHGQPSGDKDELGNLIAYEVKPHHIADALAERRLCAQAVLPFADSDEVGRAFRMMSAP
jgi:hypothetical protein